MPPLSKDVLAEDLWYTALVMICAKMARKWLQAIGRATSAILRDMDEPMEHKLSEIKADQEDVIGYVTTGDLSL
ncbi:hypothetical protein J3A83DRAFT_4366820 [Scleroderma citrinum]